MLGPSHWLHEISLPKIVCHHFWPPLIPLARNALPIELVFSCLLRHSWATRLVAKLNFVNFHKIKIKCWSRVKHGNLFNTHQNIQKFRVKLIAIWKRSNCNTHRIFVSSITTQNGLKIFLHVELLPKGTNPVLGVLCIGGKSFYNAKVLNKARTFRAKYVEVQGQVFSPLMSRFV
jgi:hypothetical protein